MQHTVCPIRRSEMLVRSPRGYSEGEENSTLSRKDIAHYLQGRYPEQAGFRRMAPHDVDCMVAKWMNQHGDTSENGREEQDGEDGSRDVFGRFCKLERAAEDQDRGPSWRRR